MKKTALLAGIVSLIAALALSTTVFASEKGHYTVTDKHLPGSSVSVSGALPTLTADTPEYKTVADRVNTKMTALYNNTIMEARANANWLRPAAFSYTVTGDEDYLSLVVRAELNAGNTSSQKLSTIVLNRDQPAIRTLRDLLGDNAYAMATQSVQAQIAKDPAQYFPESSADAIVDSNTAFYINDKSEIVVVFDKYSIAAGYVGAPEFVVGTVAE